MAQYEVLFKDDTGKKKRMFVVASSVGDAEKELNSKKIQFISIDRKPWAHDPIFDY
jgi:type II secretory pathway component PulF